MSEYQGIESEPPGPPYEPGATIYDRVAVNGAAYEVLACNPAPATLAAALAGARWQVIFEIPHGQRPYRHYMWVDDDGYSGNRAFGPDPVDPDLLALDRQLRRGAAVRLCLCCHLGFHWFCSGCGCDYALCRGKR